MLQVIEEMKRVMEYYRTENGLDTVSYLALALSARKNMCINDEVVIHRIHSFSTLCFHVFH